MLGRRRVVVTGMGILAANGIGVDAFWDSVVSARSGIKGITLFDTAGLRTTIAGEISGFRALDYIDSSLKPQRMARCSQFALAAAHMALRESRLTRADMERAQPLPVIFGVSTSATEIIEKQVLRIDRNGHKSASPFTAISSLPHAAAGAVATMLPVRSQTLTVSTGCSAGLDAIAWAADWIRSGRCSIAIAGGADAPISLLTCATFCASESMSTRNHEPEKASRPFDRDRDGGLIAEGSAVVVLETLESAVARGATPLLEILGYGSSGDTPDAEPARGLFDSMQSALHNSGLRPEDVDYVCAHGPSDRTLDRVETDCIRDVFGTRVQRLPVSSIKGVTGNPLAAAGPFQLVACALAMRHGMIPPTANLDTPDPACDLDYVPCKARRGRVDCALINNHGFGGSNSTLAVKSLPAAGISPRREPQQEPRGHNQSAPQPSAGGGGRGEKP
jgi:3-oxoacyl-[acyl-carrier-protein] synthase II